MLLSFLYLEINVVGMAILLLLRFSRGSHIKTLEQRYFNHIVVAGVFVLFFDSITWLINGQIFPGSRIIHHAAMFLYYMMNPIVSMLMLFYVDAKINNDAERLKRRIPAYSLLTIADMFILILNEMNSNMFYIDAENVYHRGSWVLIYSLISFVYMLMAAFLALERAFSLPKSLARTECIRTAAAIIPPFVGAIVQTAYFGLSLIWIAAVISLLVLYINIQDERSYRDYLTQLANRQGLNISLNSQLNAANPKGGALYMLMSDIDNFKSINDTYGHVEGDNVLTTVASIIDHQITRHDTAARYGGDEFAILCRRQTEGEVYALIESIQNAIDAHNDAANKPYKISVSMGVSACQDATDTADALISRADRDMYFNKQRNKNFITGVR